MAEFSQGPDPYAGIAVAERDPYSGIAVEKADPYAGIAIGERATPPGESFFSRVAATQREAAAAGAEIWPHAADAPLTPEEAATPLLNLPRMPDVGALPQPSSLFAGAEGAPTPVQAAGLYNAAAPLVEGLTTGQNIALLAATGGLAQAARAGSVAAKATLAATGVGFGALTAKQTLELAEQAKQILADPTATEQEQVQAAAAPVLTGGLSALLLAGGARIAAGEAIPRLNQAYPELFWRRAGLSAEQFAAEYPAAVRRFDANQATPADLELIKRINAAATAARVSKGNLARGRIIAENIEWEPRAVQSLLPQSLRPEPPPGGGIAFRPAPGTPPAPEAATQTVPPVPTGLAGSAVDSGTTGGRTLQLLPPRARNVEPLPPAPETGPSAPVLPGPGPFSRTQIATQRSELRKWEAAVRRFAETDPTKAAEFQVKAEAARLILAHMENNRLTGPTPQVGLAPDGSRDLLSDIADHVGFISTKPPEGHTGGEYDDIVQALQSGAARLLRRESGMAPDQALAIINELGPYSFSGLPEFADAIARASANRRTLAESLKLQDYRLRTEQAFLDNSGRHLKFKAPQGVPIEEMGRGATFTIRDEKFSIMDVIDDPATGTVSYVIKDGHKFVVPENTIVFPDKGQWTKPAQKPPTAPPPAPAPPPGQAPEQQPPPAPPRPADYGRANKLVGTDRAAQLREQLRAKLGNKPPEPPAAGPPAAGPRDEDPFDPAPVDREIVAMGSELAVFHLEAGSKAFPAFAEAMRADLGSAIDPYLEALYFAGKHWPGVDPTGMSTEQEVTEYVQNRQRPTPAPSPPTGPQPAPIRPGGRPPRPGDADRPVPRGETAPPAPAGPKQPDTAPRQRIITARAELTPKADEKLVPAELLPHLDAHQRQGVAAALASLQSSVGGFLFADGTGVGKTRQALAIAHFYAQRAKTPGSPSRVIIVTKAEAIKPNWRERSFGGSFRSDATAMGIPMQLARDGRVKTGEIGITTYENIGSVADHADGALLIFDEAHALKNIESKRSIQGLRAIGRAAKVLFMSATPADKPTHIHYLARMGMFEGKDAATALRELGMVQKTIERNGRVIKIWQPAEGMSAQERRRRFKAKFDRLTQQGRMIKREVAMDGVTVEVRRVPLPQEAHTLMDEIVRFFGYESVEEAPGLRKAQILMHQRRQQETYKVAAAVEMVKQELAAGRQVVVFMSRVNASEVGKWVTTPGFGGMEGERIREVLMSSEGTVKLLREALQKEGISQIAEIHGAAEQSAINEMASFQERRKPVLIATIESGGTGINLDDITGKAPRSMIVMTAPFSAVENVQAAGRIWRLKTQGDARVIYLFADTLVDEWNSDIIGSKMKQLGATVQGQVGKLDVTDPEFLTGWEPPAGSPAAIDLPTPSDEWEAAGMPPPPAGAPVAALNYGRMPVTLERTVPGNVDVADVLEALRQVAAAAGAQTAFREGRFYQDALGIAKTWSEVIRLKRLSNLPTAAHEIGHIVSKAIFGSMQSRPLMAAVGQRAAIAELTALGRALYGARKPTAGYTAEGFSELVRLWLSTEEAAQKAPAAVAWMENTLFPLHSRQAPHAELGAALRHARDLFDIWRGQGAEARIGAQIKEEPGRIARLHTWMKENLSKRAVFEEFSPLEEIDRAYEAATGRRLAPRESPYQLASALRGTAGARLETWVDRGMTNLAGHIVGPPLREAVAQIRPQLAREFGKYLLVLEAIERHKQQKHPGLEAEDLVYWRDKAQREHPEFISAASKWADWWEGVGNYVVEAYPEMNGPIWAAIRKANPRYYGPLARVLDPASTRPGRAEALGGGPHRFHGTGRPIKEIILQSLRVAENMIADAHRDAVLRSFVRLKDVPGFGWVIEEVPRSRVMERVNIEKVRRQLEDFGVDTSAIPQDTLLEFATHREAPTGVDPIISVRESGTIHWYQVPAEMFEILAGVHEPARLGALFELVAGAPSRAFKLGTTGLRPGFSLVTNPTRDLPTYLLQSIHGNPASRVAAYFAAVADVLEFMRGGRESELLQLAAQFGLQSSTFLGGDIAQTRREARALFHGRTFRRVRFPLESAREWLATPEMVPRLAEMGLALQEHGWRPGQKPTLDQMVAAMLAYRRVTVDFLAKGSKWRGLYRATPFMGAATQGARSVARAFGREQDTKQKAKTAAGAAGWALLGGFTTLTLPALALWWANKDEEWYRNLPYRERYQYLHIASGGTVFQVPLAPDWASAFITLPIALLDAWYTQDPRGVREAFKHIFETVNPVDYPVLMKAAKEQMLNRIDYFDRPIVPAGQLELLPGLQRSPYTSLLARELGDIFPDKVSPRRFDAAVRQVFGGLGSDVLDAPGAFMRALGLEVDDKRGGREFEASDVPVFGRLLRRGGKWSAQAQPIVEFWDDFTRYSRWKESIQTARQAGKGPLMPMTPAQNAYAVRLAAAQPTLRLRLEVAARTPKLEKRQEIYRSAAKFAAEMVRHRPPE